jgi:CheY-like chemotaxis protein
MKLLLVEDDERVRRMIKAIVAEVSDKIYECSDGAQACESYAKYQPDWVLMDLVMPGVDGIAATRQIRASFPTAKIVIVTSYDGPIQRRTALSAGACGYVLKENLLELLDILIVEP